MGPFVMREDDSLRRSGPRRTGKGGDPNANRQPQLADRCAAETGTTCHLYDCYYTHAHYPGVCVCVEGGM